MNKFKLINANTSLLVLILLSTGLAYAEGPCDTHRQSCKKKGSASEQILWKCIEEEATVAHKNATDSEDQAGLEKENACLTHIAEYKKRPHGVAVRSNLTGINR